MAEIGVSVRDDPNGTSDTLIKQVGHEGFA